MADTTQVLGIWAAAIGLLGNVIVKGIDLMQGRSLKSSDLSGVLNTNLVARLGVVEKLLSDKETTFYERLDKQEAECDKKLDALTLKYEAVRQQMEEMRNGISLMRQVEFKAYEEEITALQLENEALRAKVGKE